MVDPVVEPAETDPLDERFSFCMNEKPNIDVAVRNFLAIQLAKPSAPKKAKENNIGKADNKKEPEEPLDPIGVQRVCGSILRNVNSVELLPPGEWSIKVPQGETQTGLDRIDQITEYKVLYTLSTALTRKEKKITKALGKSMLRLVWPEVREKVITECDAKAVGTKQQVLELINLFGSSFNSSNMEELDYISKEEQKNIKELVWAVDFGSVLHERQNQRVETAQKRVKEVQANVNEIAETFKNTCTIEEVEDTELSQE